MVIAVANLKGSTGKTTTALHLGAALAERGHRVALWDLDADQHDLFDMAPSAGLPCYAPQPGGLRAGIEGEPADFHLIECPNRSDMALRRALEISDLVLVPASCESLVIAGVVRLLQTVEKTPAIKARACRLLITMYSSPFRAERDGLQRLSEIEAMQTVIPRAAALPKAAARGLTVFDYVEDAGTGQNAARAFRALAREIETLAQ